MNDHLYAGDASREPWLRAIWLRYGGIAIVLATAAVTLWQFEQTGNYYLVWPGVFVWLFYAVWKKDNTCDRCGKFYPLGSHKSALCRECHEKEEAATPPAEEVETQVVFFRKNPQYPKKNEHE